MKKASPASHQPASHQPASHQSATYLLLTACLFSLTAQSQAITWTANSSLPTIKRNNSVVSSGAFIYSLAGRPDADSTSGAGDDVYVGSIDNAGLITWTTGPSLPQQLSDGGAAIAGGKLYFWGGWEPAFPTRHECYYAPVAGAVISPWITSATTIPDQAGQVYADSFGRNNLVFNNRLYIINGENNTADHPEAAFYSTLTVTGDYGAWTSTSEPGDPSTWWHGIAVFQGTTANYIYKLGGGPEVNSYGSAQNTVWRAVINADGSLGTWSQLANSIPAPNGIMDFACIQDGNQIYIVGGSDNSGAAQTTTYIGDINATNGEITWSTDPSALPEARVRVSGNLLIAPNGTHYLAIVGGAAATGSSPSLATVFTTSLTPAQVEDWQVY